MKEIFFEIMQDVLEDKILYGYKAEDFPGPNDIPIGKHEIVSKQSKDDVSYGFINIPRGSGKQSRINELNLKVHMDNLAKAFHLSGESALDISRSLKNWATSWESLSDLPYNMEEVKIPTKTIRERCSRCSNMKKKELKRYDSCPECGRSLFALKGRGW